MSLRQGIEVRQIGFSTALPELRYTPGGRPVANVRVITNTRWTDRDTKEKKERADGVTWEIWGPNAENLAKLVGKGAQLYLEGTLKNHSWQGENNETRYRDIFEITYWKLLDRKGDTVDEGHGEEGDPPQD